MLVVSRASTNNGSVSRWEVEPLSFPALGLFIIKKRGPLGAKAPHTYHHSRFITIPRTKTHRAPTTAITALTATMSIFYPNIQPATQKASRIPTANHIPDASIRSRGSNSSHSNLNLSNTFIFTPSFNVYSITHVSMSGSIS